ncbi:hypothetical protein J3458_005731 [Metarhizium acridum]|uniref:uncharacterized protein n=1 Tax=Metarhizium acridum TaxID=92637 RepID=UPI001C6CDAD3|nr:hypothetical protein J3458_005731 [Metarhizium acridum]
MMADESEHVDIGPDTLELVLQDFTDQIPLILYWIYSQILYSCPAVCKQHAGGAENEEMGRTMGRGFASLRGMMARISESPHHRVGRCGSSRVTSRGRSSLMVLASARPTINHSASLHLKDGKHWVLFFFFRQAIYRMAEFSFCQGRLLWIESQTFITRGTKGHNRP